MLFNINPLLILIVNLIKGALREKCFAIRKNRILKMDSGSRICVKSY